MPSSQISSVFQAFRPKTLSAAIVPVVVGSVASFTLFGDFDPQVFWCALLGAVCIQIGTNLVNDAADFLRGADGDSRKGPRRLTQSGAMSPRGVLSLGSFFFLLALGFGIPLVQEGGWTLVVIGLVSVLMGYAYTMGPFPLAYVGLGDLFVVIFFGIVAVSTTVYLHSGIWAPEGFVLGLQVGLLSTALIAINNLRDHAEDRLAGKKTMAVRLGVTGARWEIALVVYLPYLLCTYWLIPHYSHAAVLPFFALFIGIPLVNKIFETEPSPEYNQYLGMASLHTLVFCGLLLWGLWLA
ncbi:MAG: 1,4-dihydroxy-2-naphthoate octaprenyltransferase [Bdellovibrionales bacterium]